MCLVALCVQDFVAESMLESSMNEELKMDEECAPSLSPSFRDLQPSLLHSPDAQIPTDMSDTTESDVERNR